MKNDLDELLRCVLAPKEEPGDILNRKIMEQVKEKENMKQKKYKKASAAVIAAALVASGSITAFAAWQYLSAGDVADRLGEQEVAKSFVEQSVNSGENTENTQSGIVAESQSCGGYKVSMLGLVSGEDLSEGARISNGEIHSDRSYCVVMIEREDGRAINAEQEDYFASPLIEGLNPAFYNIVTMAGNYSEFVEGGVLYRLIECDNISYFADRKLYICVTDTAFYNNLCYHYNEEDGSISRNTEYEGLNALFDLKLDASLADPVKAQALIDEIDDRLSGKNENEGDEIEMPRKTKEAMEWADKLTSENLAEYCVRLEHTVRTVSMDKNGNYVIPPYHADKEETDTEGSSGVFSSKYYNFENYTLGVPYIDGYSSSENGMEDLVITTFTLNEDGTMTHAAWVPKDVSRYLP
ncbi:MAG: hypothetical protein NC094_01465 [Bacteroidales bacterium]|nr:hypothetical protein [Lachnoclostridium sp.]MCM1384519.1 hypothetical protein [Lachnoclostridium sp.]MCM1464063.1 hypothetical protein [Bacteroidales bacterium]